MNGYRLFWTLTGHVALALGAVGLLLPVVPTTPFIIVAAFAYGRGSPRWRRKLDESPHFGPPLRAWEERGAIRPLHKAMACTAMAVSLAGAALLGMPLAVLGVQGAAMGAVALFVLTRPSA